jgi:anti-sigma factor RsiW
VTHPTNHIDDETLSAFVDGQLTPEAATSVQAHLDACLQCEDRVEGFRTVASLLRRLPSVEPLRDFALGPRLLVDPPNVVRLRRWYTVTRTAAAAMAAAFVFLFAGALYFEARPAAAPEVAFSSKPQGAAAPAAANQSAPVPTAAAKSAAAQAALAGQSPVAGAAAAPAARPVAPNQQDAGADQVAARTSVSSLPPTSTPVPTPQPTAPPVPPTAQAALPPSDSAAPLRTGAGVVGVLAVLSLLAALLVRRRISLTTPSQR